MTLGDLAICRNAYRVAYESRRRYGKDLDDQDSLNEEPGGKAPATEQPADEAPVSAEAPSEGMSSAEEDDDEEYPFPTSPISKGDDLQEANDLLISVAQQAMQVGRDSWQQTKRGPVVPQCGHTDRAENDIVCRQDSLPMARENRKRGEIGVGRRRGLRRAK